VQYLPFSAPVEIRSRGYLPHWEVDDAIYFITYRLADSLPALVVENLELEHQALIRSIGDETAVQRLSVRRQYLRRLNAYLDDSHGRCHLNNRDVAQLVVDNWKHFDHERYRLIAWCVMPNHVHVVMRHFKGKELKKTIHSWKSWTSNRANEILGLEGRFWFRDYYDYCVRSERELQRIVEYVLNNPRQIGLKDWPFVGTAGW
jgi:REP element-mobilizing transposase RayT